RAPFFKKIIERVFGIKSKDFKIDLEVKKTLSSFLLENIEFDGMTRRLSASAFVEPYKVYHMKIAIGDVGDAMYDSGVFIESESFKSYHDVYQPYYKPYQDLRKSLNFDSIFQNKVTNPIVIDSPPQIEERFEITNINFDTDKSRIHDTAEVMIRELAQYLKKNLSYRIHLLGYTDNIGSQEYNQKLSERRAKAVKELLVKNGVTEDRINFIGNNFENPLMDNSIEFGRLINRRVEIVVLE
ncbi:MAG: OmpA family protein, partial [Chitinophagales bacterium]|nr:OmpA family protein [Chitinophagales bacterium]